MIVDCCDREMRGVYWKLRVKGRQEREKDGVYVILSVITLLETEISIYKFLDRSDTHTHAHKHTLQNQFSFSGD